MENENETNGSTYKNPCIQCKSKNVSYNVEQPIYDTDDDSCLRTHKCNHCGNIWQEKYITKVIKKYVYQSML